MRFLFIAPRYHTNQTYIVKNLKKNNHKVFFQSIYKGKIEDYSSIRPFFLKKSFFSKLIESIFKSKNKHIFFFPKISECFKKYKNIKPDVVIIRFYGRLNTYIIAIVLRILKTKIIFYEQVPNDLSHLKKKKIKFFFKLIELNLQRFFFKSRWMTPLKNNQNFFKNSFFLPFIVDIKRNNLRSIKNFKILIVGKFQKRKSIYLALKSLHILSKNYKFNVSIIGEVSSNEHREQYKKCSDFIIKNNLENKIKIIKNLNHKKIFHYYKKHHLFLLPSSNEPASISLLEAIGHAMPVICSDTCGTKTYVKNEFGKIFKTNQLFSLTNAIKFFLENKKKYRFFSYNAYLFAKKNLTEENYNKYLKKNVL